jgi:AcrR family transcriptional regulator
VTATAANVVMSATGRPLGRRGAQTRRRILDAITDLVEARGLGDLRLIDVAREVGFSPPAFYQYFRDMDDALLALNEEVGTEFLGFIEMLERPWAGEDGFEAALEFVHEFVGLWDRHRGVLWARNVAVENGDERFRDVRNRSLVPVGYALADKIRASQAAGRVDPTIEPLPVSVALMGMLERMSSAQPEIESMGVGRAGLLRGVAFVLHEAVSGHPPRTSTPS